MLSHKQIMPTLIPKILIVDDEPDILDFLGYNLRKEGYETFSATNGKEAIDLARKEKPDLIILDIMMPEMDGMETCRQLRQMPDFQNTIIVFLTARDEDYSQIAGFESGADDYITKPIKPKVFVSRVKGLLRRALSDSPKPTEKRIIGQLEIDRETYSAKMGGKEITLPRKEFELLYFLTSKPGKVFTRPEILDHVWGTDVIVTDRTIDVHIRKLREKIGDEMIKTLKGVGYKFVG